MSRRAVLALIVCLLATACADEPEPTANRSPATSTPSASPAPTGDGTDAPSPSAPPSPDTAAPAATPPFPADTSRDVEQPTGAPLTVTAVRVARQDGYDRIVFELDGQEPGQPGWRVEYVDEPRRDGSGDPVEVEGAATLVVYIDGAAYPFDPSRDEPRTVAVPADAEVVREVELGSVFEGTYEAFIGTSRKAPFRVFRLADPARVVVDVRDA